MATADWARVPITFEDVAIYFTEQEWQNLEAWQKKLYQHVMRTNYETLISLDDRIPKPELISWFEQGGRPFRNWEESQTSENKICSSANWSLHFDPVIEGQLFGGSQKAVHSEDIKCHFQLVPQQDIHFGQRPFQYTDREKRFHLKNKPKAQPRRYIRKKRFSCSECGQAFIYPCALRDHMRVHSGEKPFQCPDCNKCFSLKGTLKNHQYIHRKEKGLCCGKCGKRFIFKCQLDDHITVHRKSPSAPNEPDIKKRLSRPYVMVEDDWS
ncbi:zinc finger protein 786-like [Choloepus didactylus]|uniref:zinc finger protein 786-like n=1 Tax=Choloepus didactylus TaxID=27675 RepID=UPI00189ED9A2|nr:zinc finger protein 786-like [Choloepus didactylus]